jgi:hypothetical protein
VTVPVIEPESGYAATALAGGTQRSAPGEVLHRTIEAQAREQEVCASVLLAHMPPALFRNAGLNSFSIRSVPCNIATTTHTKTENAATARTTTQKDMRPFAFHQGIRPGSDSSCRQANNPVHSFQKHVLAPGHPEFPHA